MAVALGALALGEMLGPVRVAGGALVLCAGLVLQAPPLPRLQLRLARLARAGG